MLPTKEISRLVQARFTGHESGDPIQVMNVYADEVEYWDTQCPERVKGKEGVARHLTTFLKNYDVRYALLEEHRLEGRDAAIVLWQCAVRRRLSEGRDGSAIVMQRGMSLLEVRDGLISRDEEYMDLASLQPLLAIATA
ncbi:MAG: nuclear transport factor 2 family protein [Pseudomonadota bacterium]|nr:nuclear transport factor 2 family protein [Pseudomonadota bacterium]